MVSVVNENKKGEWVIFFMTAGLICKYCLVAEAIVPLQYCNILQYGVIWLSFMPSTGSSVLFLPSSGMYTIMFWLCQQPSYWIKKFLTVAAGMGPILAINTLQQAERLGGPIFSIGAIESLPRSVEKDVSLVNNTTQK